MSQYYLTHNSERNHIMKYVAEKLPIFSIKKLILQNKPHCSNTRPWPGTNSSVVHTWNVQ